MKTGETRDGSRVPTTERGKPREGMLPARLWRLVATKKGVKILTRNKNAIFKKRGHRREINRTYQAVLDLFHLKYIARSPILMEKEGGRNLKPGTI